MKAEQINITDQNIVNILEINKFFFSSVDFFNGRYKSIITEEEREVIDPASVESAAANNPAIIIPFTPDGKTSIMNLTKISSDLISRCP